MNKLKRYDAFLEAIFGFGKKTVPYYYSGRFRDILRAISNNRDQVAQMLLYAENSNQVSDDITLIDIGSSDIMVSFIQLNRLQRFKDEETDTNVKSSDLVDYVKDVWRKTDDKLDFKGWTQQRTEISVGRFANRVFEKSNQSITSQEIEKFVNSYKTRFKMMTDMESLFEFVKGEDIRKWYLEDNYQLIRGQLGNSCMRYDRCQSYLDIYTKNTDVCQLLILHGDNEDKIIGRALIWKLKDGRTYMDRQYCIVDADVILYKEFAKKNGWLCYGDKSTEELEVQLGNYDYSSFPYMDSFVVYNYKEHLLSTNEDNWPSTGWYKLQHTNGEHLDDDVIYSEYNDAYIQRDDAVYCEDIDDWLRSDQAIYVESRDKWYSINGDSICWSEYDDTHHHVDDCVYSEYLETWLVSDESISCYVSSDEEVYIPSNMFDNLVKKVTIGGEEKDCLYDAIMINPFNGDWVFKKDSIKVFYCPKTETYITEEDAEMKELEIDKNKYKRLNLCEYISNQISDVDPEKLLNYLIQLNPSDEILEKIDKYFKNTSYRWLQDGDNFTNVDKFNIVKCGIWFAYNDSDKNGYFNIYNKNKNSQRFIGREEEMFLKFMSDDTYSKIYTKGYWNVFMEAGSNMVWDIIQDKEMRKIYCSLKLK
jgi:hypothetical protein